MRSAEKVSFAKALASSSKLFPRGSRFLHAETNATSCLSTCTEPSHGDLIIIQSRVELLLKSLLASCHYDYGKDILQLTTDFQLYFAYVRMQTKPRKEILIIKMMEWLYWICSFCSIVLRVLHVASLPLLHSCAPTKNESKQKKRENIGPYTMTLIFSLVPMPAKLCHYIRAQRVVPNALPEPNKHQKKSRVRLLTFEEIAHIQNSARKPLLWKCASATSGLHAAANVKLEMQIGHAGNAEQQSDGDTENESFLHYSSLFLVFLRFRLTFSQRKLSPFACTLSSFVRLRIHKSSDTNCRYDLVLIDYKRCYWIWSQTNPQFEPRNITAFTCSRSQFCRLSTRSKERSFTQTLCINSNKAPLRCCPPRPACCIFIMRVA